MLFRVTWNVNGEGELTKLWTRAQREQWIPVLKCDILVTPRHFDYQVAPMWINLSRVHLKWIKGISALQERLNWDQYWSKTDCFSSLRCKNHDILRKCDSIWTVINVLNGSITVSFYTNFNHFNRPTHSEVVSISVWVLVSNLGPMFLNVQCCCFKCSSSSPPLI